MKLDTEGKGNYLYFVIGAIVIFYLLNKQTEIKQKYVNPKEAELLAERECERKLRWGQWPPMSKCFIGPVIDMMHRDARGIYYNISVKVTNPFWSYPKYFVAKVMATGDERAFCTIIEGISPLHGRNIQQEKDITKPPIWLKKAQRYPTLEKLWMKDLR
jgi:hypothetical protein